MEVSAPGKLMLIGEYAVLEGAPALVAAVDRRATGRRTAAPGRESAVVSGVRRAVEAQSGPRPFGVDIDTHTFRDARDTKLGVGSSAATAVAAAALLSGTGDERALAWALEGHRLAAGGTGSGVDVAASYFGGIVATYAQPAPARPLPSYLPGLRLHVFGTGKAASTAHLVSACRSGSRWSHWCRVLTALAEEGIDAYAASDRVRFLSAVARYGRAMKGLGEDAGVSLVTERLEAVATEVAALGGAAKPSGAGGGDVAVAWLPEDCLVDDVASRTSTVVVDVSVDRRGLVIHRAEP